LRLFGLCLAPVNWDLRCPLHCRQFYFSLGIYGVNGQAIEAKLQSDLVENIPFSISNTSSLVIADNYSVLGELFHEIHAPRQSESRDRDPDFWKTANGWQVFVLKRFASLGPSRSSRFESRSAQKQFLR
jgi:hypothetical protein